MYVVFPSLSDFKSHRSKAVVLTFFISLYDVLASGCGFFFFPVCVCLVHAFVLSYIALWSPQLEKRELVELFNHVFVRSSSLKTLKVHIAFGSFVSPLITLILQQDVSERVWARALKFNPFIPSGHIYFNSLDRSISNGRDGWLVYIITIFYRNSLI